jgi:hypothetical protein
MILVIIIYVQSASISIEYQDHELQCLKTTGDTHLPDTYFQNVRMTP